MRSKILWTVALALPLAAAQGQDIKYQIHGQGWLDYGRIVNVTDTLSNVFNPRNVLDYNGNGINSVGAQITVIADLSENLEAGFGYGAYKATHALGSGNFSFLAISLFQNFLTQSRLTWYQGDKAAPNLSLTVGSFSYKYNRDVKNLGLYLLRGPVYPGILMGGYGDFHVDTSKATMLGVRLHHAIGNFSHDVILNNEREVAPTLDWSLAYLAKYRAFDAFEFGAGVNFYRLIPQNASLEAPGKDSNLVKGADLARYVDIDTTNPLKPDTTILTHQGIKVGANASLDFKALFGGMESLSPDDLKLYAEVALIGVENFGKVYGKRSERIPVMVGFNFPTWKLLDHFSVEVEYYGAKYRSDLALVGNNNVVADWTRHDHIIPSPKPVTNADYKIGNGPDDLYPLDSVKGTGLDKENLTKDDIKWSVNLDKTLSGHINLSGQVANDHFRPRPVASGLINSDGGTAEAFTTMKDWYFTVRMGYFF